MSVHIIPTVLTTTYITIFKSVLKFLSLAFFTYNAFLFGYLREHLQDVKSTSWIRVTLADTPCIKW